MSIDHLHLESTVIASLYQKVIVSKHPEKIAGAEVSTHDRISFVGDNAKSIAILVSSEDHHTLPEKELEQLSKILKACQLNLADIALINAFNNPAVNYQNIQSQLIPKYILFFGVEPEQIGFPLKFLPYKAQQYNHQVYILASSLSLLMHNNEEKTKLWDILKKTFLK